MRSHRDERGSTLLLFTLALIVMIAFIGLVVDFGWAFFRRQSAQAAADAAVLAAASASTSSPGAFVCGANGIACQDPTSCGTDIPNPPTNNLQVGCLYAQTNGFSVANGQTVLISANTTSPAPGAPGVQVPYWITVSVNEQEAQTFSSVFGKRFMTVGAHATASVFPAPGDCVYALAPTGVGLSLNGVVVVNTKCGVYVDSNASNAFNLVGNGSMTVNGADIFIVGGFSANSNTQVSPAPHTGAPVTADPLQFMPTPAVGSCTSSGVSLNGHDNATISPGVYCGSISVGGQAALILNPGTYILKNGLSVGGGTTLTGTGVTLYIQGGSLSVSGGGVVQLTAPISGTYQGIVIFQDRSNANKLSLVGGGSQFVNGGVYAAAAEIDYTGGSTTQSLSTLLVGNTIVFVGNSYLTATPKTGYSGGAGGPTLIQ